MAARPVHHIDPQAFRRDPYPDLAIMRAETPVCHVPELDAVLLTRRDDIFREEKNIAVFSSDQPEGLMTVLMGQNMMRKDGAAHAAERKAIFPTTSPRTVRDHWKARFIQHTKEALDAIENDGKCDLVKDFAMPVSAHALRVMTGLENMAWQEMDRVSQGMIDGCANYAGDAEVEARCHDCTASIDRHIAERIEDMGNASDLSLLSVQRDAGLPPEQVSANIKLAISGGQNEPRDAIAGTAWALLSHPGQFDRVKAGEAGWLDAFEEYARWQSPIGMSPRRVARDHELEGCPLPEGSRAFLMFGSGNRDARHFANPDAFDLSQDRSKAISFGAGPHFCAGAWAARALIGEVALPMLFERLPGLELDGPVEMLGWAFRGPVSVPVRW